MMAEEEFQVRHVVSNRRDRPNLHVQVEDLQAALLIPGLFPGSVQTALVLLQRGCVICYPSVGTEDFFTASLGWTPSVPAGSPLQTPPLAWLPYGNDLELIGIDDGVVNWSRLHFGESRMEVVARSTAVRTTSTTSPRANFTAATLVRPSLVAGVSAERIEWLRAGATQLTLQSSTAGGVATSRRLLRERRQASCSWSVRMACSCASRCRTGEGYRRQRTTRLAAIPKGCAQRTGKRHCATANTRGTRHRRMRVVVVAPVRRAALPRIPWDCG